MKKIVFYSLLLTSFSLLSCPNVVDTHSSTPLPKAILIDFTFKNETQSPITVKIRHKYHWQWDDMRGLKDIVSYTDWSVETVESGRSKPIGVEKSTLSDAKSTWEVEGFFLLDNYSASISKGTHYFYSSFELEIETENDILVVSDDTVYIPNGINDTELCYLKIFNPYNTCDLVTYKQHMRVKKLFTLPITLTLQIDGTLAFEHETVINSDGIYVFPES